MAIDQDLPLDLATRVEEELESGERLLWTGQPRPGRFFLQSLPAFLFGIPWTMFAVFWTLLASGMFFGQDAPGPEGPGGQESMGLFALFGVPFILIGLGLLSSPFWAHRKAKRTVYAITEKRALIFEGGMGTKVRSFAASALDSLERTERADGSGDIVFERQYYRGHKGGQRVRTIGFLGIRAVREVEQLLEEARRSGRN
jgi:hypothetical protein